jgi:hypothetical protein
MGVHETGRDRRYHRSTRRTGIGLSERPVPIRTGVDKGVMGQGSVRQAARRSALDAQAALRKERADRGRRLEALAVAVLTPLGERDGAVRDAERRVGQALQTVTNDEGLSLRKRPNSAAAASLCER